MIMLLVGFRVRWMMQLIREFIGIEVFIVQSMVPHWRFGVSDGCSYEFDAYSVVVYQEEEVDDDDDVAHSHWFRVRWMK